MWSVTKCYARLRAVRSAEHTALRQHEDQPFFLQGRQRSPRCRAGDLILLGHLPLRRHRSARRPLAGCKPLTQLLSHLGVQGRMRVPIDHERTLASFSAAVLAILKLLDILVTLV